MDLKSTPMLRSRWSFDPLRLSNSIPPQILSLALVELKALQPEVELPLEVRKFLLHSFQFHPQLHEDYTLFNVSTEINFTTSSQLLC